MFSKTDRCQIRKIIMFSFFINLGEWMTDSCNQCCRTDSLGVKLKLFHHVSCRHGNRKLFKGKFSEKGVFFFPASALSLSLSLHTCGFHQTSHLHLLSSPSTRSFHHLHMIILTVSLSKRGMEQNRLTAGIQLLTHTHTHVCYYNESVWTLHTRPFTVYHYNCKVTSSRKRLRPHLHTLFFSVWMM